MHILRWLCPGLKIKRWLLLAFAGVVLVVMGFSAASGTAVLAGWEAQLNEVFFMWFGGLIGPAGVVMAMLGLMFFVCGFSLCVKSIMETLAPEKNHRVLDSVYQKRYLARGPKIVAIGGGTGLSTLLRGLKEYSSNLTAIVTVTDDGGSSGMLKGDFDMLPPGDIRNCLVALADTEGSMQRLFDYRFEKGGGLAGHSLGNLLLAAMKEMEGDFYKAVKEVESVLAVRGNVVPSTLTKVTLGAQMESGTIVYGESKIAAAAERIQRVFLVPKKCRPPEEAVQAVKDADIVVLGPGSLYTSVIPNLLIKGIVEALERTRASIFYVCNIMTQPGETDGFDAVDHLSAINSHVGSELVDFVVVNAEHIPNHLLRRYHEEGASPVASSVDRLRSMGVQVLADNFLDDSSFVRHNSLQLARTILKHAAYSNGTRLETKAGAGNGVKTVVDKT